MTSAESVHEPLKLWTTGYLKHSLIYQQSYWGTYSIYPFMISGSLAVFSIGHISADWRRWGDMAIVGVSGLTAILLYCMATYSNIWLAYVLL